MTLSAEQLYRRARADLNAGRNAAARRNLARAAERTDDTDLRARIAGSMAAVVIRQGDPDAAERMCREALALPSLSRATAAMLRGQLGLLALERGDLDEAVTLLDRGIAGIGDEVEHRAAMLINRSVAHLQAGRLADGRRDLERAAADYAATGQVLESAMAVHNTGYAALLAGDLVGALELMAQAEPVLASASAVNAAICDLDRSEVLRDAGLVTDAERSLERVASVFGAHRMRQARAEAEFHLARSLLVHSPDRAARAAASAARRFRRVDSDWWALRAYAVRLRALLAPTLLGALPDAVRPAPRESDVTALAEALRSRGLTDEATSLELSWELWRGPHRRSGSGRAASGSRSALRSR